MGMTLDEARSIGKDKLDVKPELFAKCVEAARRLEVRDVDMGPMVLILAVLGYSDVKAGDSDVIQREMGDAIELIQMAEKEWQLEQITGRGHS